MALIRIEYPAWHDEARARKEKGESQPQLADAYGVSRGRMSQIATPNWKAYVVLQRVNYKERRAVQELTKNIDAYEFVPVDSPVPKGNDDWAKRWSKKKEQEDMPMEREFETVKKYEHGKTLVGAGIRCSKCGSVNEFYHNKGGRMPAVFLSKEFSKRDWIVGAAPRTDLCPECSKALRTHKKEEPMTTIKSFKDLVDTRMADEHHQHQHEVLHLPTEQPAEPLVSGPGKTERRIIFAKLNDIYIDENTGYTDDWDDLKVAADLGVIVDWVKIVRDADFGPEINAAKRKKASEELNEMFNKMERLDTLIEAKIKQSDALSDKVTEAMRHTEEAFERFDALVKNLNTHDEQIATLIEQHRKDAEALKELKKELVPGTTVA